MKSALEHFLHISCIIKFKGISLKVIEILNIDSYNHVKKGISYYGYKISAPILSYIKISVVNMTMEGPNIDDCMYGGIFIMEATPSGRRVKPGVFKTNVQLCNMEYSHKPGIPLSFVSESNATYLAIYTSAPYSSIEASVMLSFSKCQGQYLDYYEVLRNGNHITAEITSCSAYHILPLPHQFFTQNPDVKDTEQITNNIKNKVLKFILAKSNEQLAADLKGYLFAYSDRLQLYTYNGQKYPNHHNKVMMKDTKWRNVSSFTIH